MSYLPKTGQEENLENLVSKRIDELLSSIKSVSTMYVEPGDIVVVKVDENIDDNDASKLRKMLSSVFNQNKGVFLTEGIDVQVVKTLDQVVDTEKENLKKLVSDLDRRIRILEGRLEDNQKGDALVSQ